MKIPVLKPKQWLYYDNMGANTSIIPKPHNISVSVSRYDNTPTQEFPAVLVSFDRSIRRFFGVSFALRSSPLSLFCSLTFVTDFVSSSFFFFFSLLSEKRRRLYNSQKDTHARAINNKIFYHPSVRVSKIIQRVSLHSLCLCVQ